MGFNSLKENGLPRRAFFTRTDCNFHCYTQGRPEIAWHLLFCHWLKKHLENCEYCNNLKKNLLQKNTFNHAAYTNEKTSSITKIEMHAGHDGFKIVEVFSDHEYQEVNKHRKKMRLPTLTSVPIGNSEYQHLAHYSGAVIGYDFVKKCP